MIEVFKEISEKVYKEVKKTIRKYRRKIISCENIEKAYEIVDKLHEKTDKISIEIIRKENINANILIKDKNLKIHEIKLVENPEYYIILDTIDGSANLARDFPFYSFSFSVLKGKRIEDTIYSKVICFVSDDRFEAIKGKGAYFNSKQIKVKKLNNVKHAIIGLDVYLESLNYNKRLIKFVNKLIEFLSPKGDIRRIGTNAFAQCLVAKGSLDMFIDLRGTQSILEIIPSKLVVEEAGRIVTDESGKELSGFLHEKENTSVIFSSSKKLIDEILEIYKKS